MSNLNHHRTNNDIEGWHRKLLSIVGEAPRLWKFLRRLQVEYRAMDAELTQMQGGQVIVRRRAKYKRIDASLRLLKLQYINVQPPTLVADMEYISHVQQFMSH